MVLTLSILSEPLSAQPSNQQGSPIPGNQLGFSNDYPASHANEASFAPVPGSDQGSNLPPEAGSLPASAQPQAKSDSIYEQLPLSVTDAKNKIEELSNRLAVSRPDQVKDNIFALAEWLQDVADAHWKMFKAFEKNDLTKLQAQSEKETALQFSRLKNKTKLLKADLFIKMNRYPEALGPLVDIVVAEPRSETGQSAYKRLVDMGFSKQVAGLEIAASEPAAKD